MPTQTATQGRTINISTFVTRDFDKEVRVQAAIIGISKSEAIRQGLELWLEKRGKERICPICSGPVHDDPSRPDVLFCPECNEPVAFIGEPV